MKADFERSFELTMGHEGGYSNDPNDAGGETYRGISRRYHPSWPGWGVVDGIKINCGDLKKVLGENAELLLLVKAFYKDHFWNKFLGDEIPDQMIADELFDTSVNMGIEKAVRFLQISLNVLNRNQKNYPDIIEDGVLGPNTLKVLKSYLAYLAIDRPDFLLKVMNVLQGMHYIEYMRKSPIQEKYARGWFNRVYITKN